MDKVQNEINLLTILKSNGEDVLWDVILETITILLKHVALCDLTLELELCFIESYWVRKALFLIAAHLRN